MVTKSFVETDREEAWSQIVDLRNYKINRSKVILDSFLYLRYLSRACFQSVECPISKGPQVKVVGINGQSWESQENVVLKLKLFDSIRVEHNLLILDSLPTKW
jgi:hypothetical protein